MKRLKAHVCLKNNKAVDPNGLPAELFKTGYIYKIRLEICVPNIWILSVLCTVLKESDSTICDNYGGTSLLLIPYKVLTGVL